MIGHPETALPFGGPLDYLVEQVWSPALAAGTVRLTTGGAVTPGWQTVEDYVVVPSLRRATMLLPRSPRAALVGALTNHRGLRRLPQNLQRRTLGTLARSGGLPFPRLRVEVRTGGDGPPGAATLLPLAELAQVLDVPDLRAAIGVRTGANRKATLQLVDSGGNPVGFAKLGWSPASSAGVIRERDALRGAAFGPGVRAPDLLADGELHGRPWLVTAPLPLDARGVRHPVPGPSAKELHALTPLVRRDRVAGTRHFTELLARLETPSMRAAQPGLVEAALRLASALAASDRELPVVARWHGDFTPWNCARDTDGVFWAWDWESSEPDAVAGLDAIHWHTTVGLESGEVFGARLLEEARTAAAPLLVAAGIGRETHPVVHALHALVVAERACALATGPAGWEDERLRPHQLREAMEQARYRLVRGA